MSTMSHRRLPPILLLSVLTVVGAAPMSVPKVTEAKDVTRIERIGEKVSRLDEEVTENRRTLSY